MGKYVRKISTIVWKAWPGICPRPGRYLGELELFNSQNGSQYHLNESRARVCKQIDSSFCGVLTDDLLGAWASFYLVSPLPRALEDLLTELERAGFADHTRLVVRQSGNE